MELTPKGVTKVPRMAVSASVVYHIGMYTVETGKGRSAYTTKWTFSTFNQALAWYCGLNTHSGYKKRLVTPEGKVYHRVIS